MAINSSVLDDSQKKIAFSVELSVMNTGIPWYDSEWM